MLVPVFSLGTNTLRINNTTIPELFRSIINYAFCAVQNASMGFGRNKNLNTLLQITAEPAAFCSPFPVGK